MTAATLAIEASGLAKRFGATRAVDGIDVAVPRGGVFGLLGPNGAGKTTTIRIFATLTRPDSGSARVLANEPDLLAYYADLDEDASEASLVQIHRNASSADHHMEITAEKIAQGLAVTTTVRAEVYGTPGGRQLTVRGLDAVNQTPVLDIKPVMRQLLPTKAHQTAWVAALMTDYLKPSTASRGAASQRRP